MDPISDLFSTIKNGYMAGKKEIKTDFSKLKSEILALLKKSGLIQDFSFSPQSIKILLKYQGKEPAIKEIKRISTPGRRIYIKRKDLEKRRKPKLVIISTPQGIMTGIEAREKGIGGEVIGEIL